jgi:hypothetical protein
MVMTKQHTVIKMMSQLSIIDISYLRRSYSIVGLKKPAFE